MKSKYLVTIGNYFGDAKKDPAVFLWCSHCRDWKDNNRVIVNKWRHRICPDCHKHRTLRMVAPPAKI